jgi:PEP-CTERM motif
MRKLIATIFATLSLAVLPSLAVAEPIVGQIDLSGNNVRVTGTTIDWFALGGGTGTIDVTGAVGYFGATGPYGSLIGEIDTLLDLNLAVAPPGDPFDPIDEFQTISNTGLNFTLDRIATCEESGIPALCPAGGDSPFVFTPLGTGGSTVSLSMSGTVIDTNNPGFLSTWTGNFSADSPDSVADTLALFVSQGFLELPYSATKITVDVPVIPEPASMILLGTGLLGLAVRARSKRSKKA